MIWIGIASLAGIALLLEWCWRAPDMDENGRVTGPSLHDESRRRVGRRA